MAPAADGRFLSAAPDGQTTLWSGGWTGVKVADPLGGTDQLIHSSETTGGVAGSLS